MYRGTQPSQSQPVIRNTEDTSIVVPRKRTSRAWACGGLCVVVRGASTAVTAGEGEGSEGVEEGDRRGEGVAPTMEEVEQDDPARRSTSSSAMTPS